VQANQPQSIKHENNPVVADDCGRLFDYAGFSNTPTQERVFHNMSYANFSFRPSRRRLRRRSVSALRSCGGLAGVGRGCRFGLLGSPA
jgi:hypothetical protein